MSGVARGELQRLTTAAATAKDSALARVVSMVDSLKDRGEADRILALARDRLRVLRPPRPLGFTRLLFLPLDGAVVPSPRWRRGEAQLPRGALGVIGAAVQAALGPEATAIAARCAGHTSAEPVIAAEIGDRLWPLAATAVPELAPADWGTTGLSTADYPPIAALCAAVWPHGSAIYAAMRAAGAGPPDDLVRAALTPLVAAGPHPFATALASLLRDATAPGRVAAAAAAIDPRVRGLALAGLDALLEEPMPSLDTLDLRGATHAAQQLAQRLNDLEGCVLLGPDRQRKLAAIRRGADEACRERCLAAAEQQVLTPMVLLLGRPEVEDTDVAGIEAGARGLRSLAAVGRKLGDPAAYDRALRAATGSILKLAGRAGTPGGLGPMDLARTIEILAGPDAAAAALAGPRAAAA